MLEDGGHQGERLHVVDQRRLRPQARLPRIGRLVARLAPPIFQRLEQRRLLAEDVAAGRDEDVDVEVLAQHAAPARVVERELHGAPFRLVLVAHVNPAAFRPGHQAGETHPFDYQMRQLFVDHPVLEGTRLALVGVADDELGRGFFLAHQLPLEAGGEAGAAHAAQLRLLERRDDLGGRGVHVASLAVRLINRVPAAPLAAVVDAPAPGPSQSARCQRLGVPRLMCQLLWADPAHRDAVDQSRRRVLAATEARDLVHIHVVFPVQQLSQPGGIITTLEQVARQIPADGDLGAGRRRSAEVAVEGDDLLDPIERYAEPLGQGSQVVLAEIPALFLQAVKLADQTHG